MKYAALCAASVAALFASCADDLADEQEPQCPAPETPDAAASPRLPKCIGLSPGAYGVFYDFCADWHVALPTPALCIDGAPAGSCVPFESAQRYDHMFCCCDPQSSDECFNVYR